MVARSREKWRFGLGVEPPRSYRNWAMDLAHGETGGGGRLSDETRPWAGRMLEAGVSHRAPRDLAGKAGRPRRRRASFPRRRSRDFGRNVRVPGPFRETEEDGRAFVGPPPSSACVHGPITLDSQPRSCLASIGQAAGPVGRRRSPPKDRARELRRRRWRSARPRERRESSRPRYRAMR